MAKGATIKNIFVSYRRSDSSDVTGRIFDQMKARFGEDHLFKDVDSIPLGQDFRTVVSDAVGKCEVLLAIIGKDWLKITDDNGRRRVDDPNDYVHIEIATALNRHIPVIPVLVENSAMPRPTDLPEPLRDLAFRNCTPVRSDPDFHHDIDRLCSQLTDYLPKRRIRRPAWAEKIKYGRFWVWAFSGIAVCVALLFLVMSSLHSTRNKQSVPVPIRFWIEQLPEVPEGDATKLFSNALGSWQAVVATPIRKADAKAEANVIVLTAPDTIAVVSNVGPPTSETSPIRIWFGSRIAWTPRTFEAASGRMLGHVLGLTYTNTPGQMMTENVTLELLPLTPQPEDIKRVRQIWDK